MTQAQILTPRPIANAESAQGAAAVYRVKEYAPIDVPLSELLDPSGALRLNSDVQGKDYFTIQLVGGQVRLQARGYVGLIPLNERVIIDVIPRTPVKNLSRLLMVSQCAPDLLVQTRSYSHDPVWANSLLDAYAYSLLSQMEELASKGLFREYDRRIECTSFPRGRILTTSTIRQLHVRGVQHKAVASWFERGSDNPANRCLKYALWFLARRLSRVPPVPRHRLRLLDRFAPLYTLLDDVELDHSLDFLHDGLVKGTQRLPTLRSYYRPALDLAAAIILEHGIKVDSGGEAVELPSLVLNMNRLFENYLRNVLRLQRQEHGWEHEILDGNIEGSTLLFDEPPSEKATPDIVFRDPATASVSVIVEVKNVPVKGTHSDRSAIEQAVTYGASYGCNRIVIAHPRAHSSDFAGLRLQGQMDRFSIYQYLFDLSADPLEGEEEQFAAAIKSLTADHAQLQRASRGASGASAS